MTPHYRPRVPPHIKRVLLQQTSGKCANPGCPNRLLELHHIKQWAVYQTHDEASMIAICPTCHDSVTRGSLRITDAELYRWKGIERSNSTLVGHLFVEPAPIPQLVLGDVSFVGLQGITIFEFENAKLALAVRDQDIAILNLKLVDSLGQPLVDVVDGYVRQRSPAVTINSRPGRYQVVVANPDHVYPPWARECLSRAPSPFNDPAHFETLDIQVLEPGTVRVKGVLLHETGGLVIDDSRIFVFSRRLGFNLAFEVAGSGRATINFMGSIDQSVLGEILPPDFW